MITKQQLGNYLWGMAERLYGRVEDYKTYVLTLLFFKRLSDNYEWEEKHEIEKLEAKFKRKLNDKMIAEAKKGSHKIKIPKDCFWTDIKEAPLKKKNELLEIACDAIADKNKPLRGIINAVRWNAPAPDGKGGKRLDPEVLQELINYLNGMNLSNDNVPLDVLGHAYEYLIKKFADENKSGKVAGQFYTPPEIVDLIVRTLKPKRGETVYDPTCGSGGMLIRSAAYVKEKEDSAKGLQLYGQETVWTTWAIATMNIFLHGLEGTIEQGDTLRDPQFKDDNGDIAKFNIAIANFPFSLENWAGNGEQKTDKKGRPLYKKDGTPEYAYPSKDSFSDKYNRYIFGVPNFSNGDFAFIQHILASLKNDGRAGIVCPNGVLFKGQPEKTEEEDGSKRKADDDYLIRRKFIEGIGKDKRNILDAIVALPENLFYGNTIPGCILFFNKKKAPERANKILMVNAARKGWYKEVTDQNELRPQDVMRLLVQLESWGDKKEALKIIPVEEKRLCAIVDDTLDYKLLEIDDEYKEEQQDFTNTQKVIRLCKSLLTANKEMDFIASNEQSLKAKIEKGKIKFLPEGKNKLKLSLSEKNKLTIILPEGAKWELTVKKEGEATVTNGDIDKLEKKLQKLSEKIAERDSKKEEARAEAKREKEAIKVVSNELREMFDNPEQRKKYFSIVEMDEIIENEFNLNIPRYIDTVEPEEQIEIADAVSDLKEATRTEKEAEENLNTYLAQLVDEV